MMVRKEFTKEMPFNKDQTDGKEKAMSLFGGTQTEGTENATA